MNSAPSSETTTLELTWVEMNEALISFQSALDHESASPEFAREGQELVDYARENKASVSEPVLSLYLKLHKAVTGLQANGPSDIFVKKVARVFSEAARSGDLPTASEAREIPASLTPAELDTLLEGSRDLITASTLNGDHLEGKELVKCYREYSRRHPDESTVSEADLAAYLKLHRVAKENGIVELKEEAV